MSRLARKTSGLPASAAFACLLAGLFVSTAVGRQAQAPADSRDAPAPGKVDPQINAQFKEADVEAWIKRFESESREVYARRAEIVAALDLKPGASVADVGAGTGLFSRLMAEKVGARGRVYAVDVSEPFLKYIADQSRKLGLRQIQTVKGSQTSTNLEAGSVDLVFFCDVYHHLEDPRPVLASIHQALRPKGALVLIEFDRARAKDGSFIKKHVRADKEQFVREIEQAGFSVDPSKPTVKLGENYYVRFLKNDQSVKTDAAKEAAQPVDASGR